MRVHASDIIVGVLVIILGLLGLFLAAFARDAEMAVFGWGLVVFAALFVFGLVRRHYDALERSRSLPQ